MVRANVRPEDYVVMRVQRAGDTSPATGLINEADLLPRLTKANGTRLVPPRQYQLDPPGPNAWDPVDLAHMTGTRAASGETHVLGIGLRNAHPHTWNATVDTFVNVPVVCYIDGISVSEFAYQHFNQIDTLEFWDNPTMQGGVLEPLTISDDGFGTAALDNPQFLIPSPKTHLVMNEGANGAAYYEGATRPIHYDAGGRIQGAASGRADHGEALDEVSVFWDQLQFEKIELNVGNRARVHRLTGWGYQRREWTGTEAPPHRFTFGLGVSLLERPLGNKFDTVEVHDIEDHSGPVYDKSSVIAGFGTPNQSIDFVELGNAFYTYVVETGQRLPVGTPTDPQAFATQRGAISVTDSATGLCIAMVAKLNNDPWPFDGCITPNSLSLRFPCWDKFDGFTHPQLFSHTGPYFQVNTSDDTHRASGWVSASCLMYIGDRANLQAALDNIHDTGLLDQAKPEPPEAVWTGTEWPPQTPPGVITVDFFDDAVPGLPEDGGDIDICNEALANIGHTTPIESIDPPDEGSREAEQCARYYPQAKNLLFQMMSACGFALRRAELVAVAAGSHTTAYDYAYAVPDDLLELQGVHIKGAGDDKTPQDAVIELDPLGTKVILTDAPPGSWMRYRARNIPTSQWSPLFREALGFQLASKLAGVLIGGVEGRAAARDMLLMRNDCLARAGVSEARQRRLDVRTGHKPFWLDGRG